MSYLSEILADAPSHYWRLADPPGRIAFDLGSAPRHLLVDGTTEITGLGYSGPASDGGSVLVEHDGAVDSHNGITSTPSFTLEAWVWPFQLGTAGCAMAWDYTSGGASVQITGSDHPFISSGPATLTGPAVVTRQQWHHIVGTIGPLLAELWWDGVSQGTIVSAPAVFTKQVLLGQGGGQLLGWISEAAIYPIVLPNARIAAHFAAADNLGQQPVYRGGGAFANSSGTGLSPADIAALIYAAVHKVY